MEIIDKDPTEILNYCSKYLARGDRFGQPAPMSNPALSTPSEAWRFPILESYARPQVLERLAPPSYELNAVTLVYWSLEAADVQVVGTFGKLYEPVPLAPVLFEGEPTGYFSLTVVLPIAVLYRYRFLVDGQQRLDPVNPQRTTLANGKEWSCFFTDFYPHPTVFEEWELRLIYRLAQQILPFQTAGASNFLKRFYSNLKPTEKHVTYVMDQTVGEVNYIDNALAREENHHLIDYRICLDQIDRVLRQRNPFVESWEVSRELILELYDEMAADNVSGWDKQKYNSPRYFLELLRRHVIIGAFCHPKYGGNYGAGGWAYLQERYRDDDGQTLYDWPAAIEPPTGRNEDYIG